MVAAAHDAVGALTATVLGGREIVLHSTHVSVFLRELRVFTATGSTPRKLGQLLFPHWKEKKNKK